MHYQIAFQEDYSNLHPPAVYERDGLTILPLSLRIFPAEFSTSLSLRILTTKAKNVLKCFAS